jgi:hypothetical protein
MVGVAAVAGEDDVLSVPKGEVLVVVTAPRVLSRKKLRNSKLQGNLKDGAEQAAPESPEVLENAEQELLEPFPTLYYLTHPTYVAAVSRLEAGGLMKQLQLLIDPEAPEYDEELHNHYSKAHWQYITDRDELAVELGLEPLTSTHADFSAGGMPTRIKCLHALVGHALATRRLDGSSDNPIGDLILTKYLGSS